MDNQNRNRKRQSTYEQKVYAVEEVLKKGRHRKDVASELDIHVNSLGLWINKYKTDGPSALRPAAGRMASHEDGSEAEELKQLKEITKKYDDLVMENEILKKFQAFLKESEKGNGTKP